MCLGEPAKNVSRAKKQIPPLLGERIEVRAKYREVRNSVESAMYEPVVIMQFPDAAPPTPALSPQSGAREISYRGQI
jgi:hypothetical protein